MLWVWIDNFVYCLLSLLLCTEISAEDDQVACLSVMWMLIGRAALRGLFVGRPVFQSRSCRFYKCLVKAVPCSHLKLLVQLARSYVCVRIMCFRRDKHQQFMSASWFINISYCTGWWIVDTLMMSLWVGGFACLISPHRSMKDKVRGGPTISLCSTFELIVQHIWSTSAVIGNPEYRDPSGRCPKPQKTSKRKSRLLEISARGVLFNLQTRSTKVKVMRHQDHRKKPSSALSISNTAEPAVSLRPTTSTTASRSPLKRK
jgi:hypothetical protein